MQAPQPLDPREPASGAHANTSRRDPSAAEDREQ
eukprot:CAMPEP_0177389802 /NCGR_PEP_ID=MMETSP0368-20130122/52789_1 /TAXON_ID=447022 ORGANISM="Scrippsiella hangoei-like, Strain SHHI-4" /NCGR_SAMPLE_ID=MMETSP0368 /ASSEMBLY_ACC=CAM_ASM_000363 /LENGTH=33 /DNA_ID= /DNA_START= /DNA_END= /DNA_ORIENTATION=